MDKIKFFEALMESAEGGDKEDWSESHDLSLEQLAASYNKKHTFKAGDTVRWKPGMRITSRPKYSETGIVIEILKEPFRNDKAETGTPYFMEPQDIRIGLTDERGTLIIYHFDSSRFEPIKKKH